MRNFDQRLRALERPGPIRMGGWVIGPDESGKIAVSSPDRSVELTPDPPPPADITAGILPGLFSAFRAADSGHDAASGYQLFAADWYDTVETSSDRMVFDSATNTVRVESTALLGVRIQQGVASGQIGERHFRSTLSLAYDEEAEPVVIRTGSNSRYAGSAELVFADTFFVPVNAGALLTPGYWCNDSPLGALTGDASGLLSRFEVVRLLDL